MITLRKKRDFDRLFKEGARCRHRLLMTVVARRRDDGPPRAAFVVGIKVDKRAVVRNRVRRRLREAWRRALPHVAQGVDVAFVARPPAAEATYRELAAVMSQHLERTGATRGV